MSSIRRQVRSLLSSAVVMLIATVVASAALAAVPAAAQEVVQTGSIAGRVTDDQGLPLFGAQVFVEGTNLGAQTRFSGEYLLVNVPAGTHTVRARIIGYRSQAAPVTVIVGQRASQNFSMERDPLSLQAVVVTGTVTPRTNLESSVAVTTLTPQIIEQAVPRSTTEMLRYVPGFTRVESSGGEVNQNISMRGILGVEYVMFMEDGLPVFPTMHTFFMNADNLFRPDENIERLEVVRGGSSALFGSSTPGAIVNFINKSGGEELSGTLKATGATQGLARYDLNINGPLGDDWRFNLGGFYRYDHGVRDPGFPGIRGGQIKANVTRLLENGYVRASFKAIGDRNQFILPLPFQNPDDHDYVPGFSDYGAMTTPEGNHIRVPIPTGELELPLDNGLRTDATWLTADAAFDLANGWRIQNTAQVMRNAQEWNAIVPFDILPAQDWIAGQSLPSGYTGQLFFTNVPDVNGRRTPFNTANGLVAPSGEWHVEKPLTAFQNQLQLKRNFGGAMPTNLSFGAYFAHYTQDNRWFFTEILTDVRDNPHFVDLIAVSGADTIEITKNGFRNFLSLYVNGSGQTTIASGVIGASTQLTPRLRADAGLRYEWNEYDQSVENTSPTDLDSDPTTRYNNNTWGNGTFKHLQFELDDWAGSLGLNFLATDQLAVYAQASRAYKMPALDEFLFADVTPDITGRRNFELMEARETRTLEGGVKYATGTYGLTVNGFFAQLKNIASQGAETDPSTGQITWITRFGLEQSSLGAEIEAYATPAQGLQLIASGTFLRARYGDECPESGRCVPDVLIDTGSTISGVPPYIGNVALTYAMPSTLALPGLRLTADWHLVGRRFAGRENAEGRRPELPAYSYFNFGAAYRLRAQSITISADLLNALQAKGLEEGNPRLPGAGVSNLFLARPLLPRRLMVSLRYDF